MNKETTITVYAPLDQLPAEGFECPELAGEPGSRENLLAFYREVLAQSDLVFQISADGSGRNPETVEFGKFTLQYSSDGGAAVPMLVPVDEESIHLQFEAAFAEAVSDAAEPHDLVRGFLNRLRPVINSELDEKPLRRTPLIRWEAEDSGDIAFVHLLGILEMPEEEFDAFLEDSSEIDPVLEEAEVEAHGLRETAAALAVLGLTALSSPNAEAGLLKNLFGKRDSQPAAVQVQQQQQTGKTQAARTGWIDNHKDAKIDKNLLANHDGTGTRVVVDVSRQRAYVLIDGRIAIDTAISTARAGKYTPRGSYTITEKVRSGKHSTIYGCEMPYWQRLGDSPIGLHIGDLPGYPASAGCVRLPYSVAPVIFDATKSGTKVKIVDSWDLATNLWADEDAAKTMIASVDLPAAPPVP
jgi:lipoprotein-anchoring transpeptidase ErfK/SrfK